MRKLLTAILTIWRCSAVGAALAFSAVQGSSSTPASNSAGATAAPSATPDDRSDERRTRWRTGASARPART